MIKTDGSAADDERASRRPGWWSGAGRTSGGTSATAQAGCLIVLDAGGTVVRTIAGDPVKRARGHDGVDFGAFGGLFATKVLNGSGRRTAGHGGKRERIRLWRADRSRRLGGRADRRGLQPGHFQYLADTVGNRITAIPGAMGLASPRFGTGFEVTSGVRPTVPGG